jgi:hypothetical protein
MVYANVSNFIELPKLTDGMISDETASVSQVVFSSVKADLASTLTEEYLKKVSIITIQFL